MTKVKERIKVYHEKVKELFGEKAKKTAQKVGYGERERKISASLSGTAKIRVKIGHNPVVNLNYIHRSISLISIS
jgi:ABC-type histidine transport system ATPase subunit